MLLRRLRSRLPPLLHGNGGGPCGGSKPASEGTGQAKACPTRSAIEVKQPSTSSAGYSNYGATAPRTNQVATPGRGIYHDGRTLARGFQDGNLLWRRGNLECCAQCGRQVMQPASTGTYDESRWGNAVTYCVSFKASFQPQSLAVWWVRRLPQRFTEGLTPRRLKVFWAMR